MDEHPRQRVPRGAIRALLTALRAKGAPVDRPTFKNPQRAAEARDHIAETIPRWGVAEGRAELDDIMRSADRPR